MPKDIRRIAQGKPVAISVIVPVYNVEEYLRECLDSVQAQTLQDMEVVLVNDGSTDGSAAILEEFACNDERFRVIAKPNGGYGSAVNEGIQASEGEYIAIVEPDDIVAPRMMEDLLSASVLPNGKRADIVKSAFWNYYDPKDGNPPYREPSSLMIHMPDHGMVFDVHKHWNVLYHHPSIWSAIYKRSFLDAKSIRMHELPGAAWADNPWFYETILQAHSIVWVPRAYYCYRQTNPESSSYLKDFNLPFDRLADIYAIAQRLNENDPHVMACIYHRTFGYIKSVLEKFGFPEADPAVFARITEALGRIDPHLLYTAKTGVRKDHIAYYEHAMGIRARKVRPHKAVDKPAISIILPLGNDRPFAWEFLDSCANQTDGSFEVLCAEADSQDTSRRIAESYALRDKRMRVLPDSYKNTSDAVCAALAAARGDMVLVADAEYPLPSNLVERAHLSIRQHPNTDMHLFSAEMQDAASLAEIVTTTAAAEGHALPSEARARILELAHPIASTCLYARSFLSNLAQRANGKTEDPERGYLGNPVLLLWEATALSESITTMGALDMQKQPYRWVDNSLAYVDSSDSHRRECLDYLPCLEARIVNAADPALTDGWRGFAAKAICHDLASIHRQTALDDYSDRLHAALDCNTIMLGNSAHLLNAACMNRLELALSNSRLRFFEDRALEEEQKRKTTQAKLQQVISMPLYAATRKAYKAGKKLIRRR